MKSEKQPRESVLAEWLKQKGLSMPEAPQPKGFYTPVVVTGNLAHVAGQLPMMGGSLVAVGSLSIEDGIELAQQAAIACLLNQWAALDAAGISLRHIKRIVKLTGYVQCQAGFSRQSLVMNAASDLCLTVLGEAGIHARVAVGASALPFNATVEIDGLYELEPASEASL